MHVWSSRRCLGSSAFQIESVVFCTRLRGQPAMSRQLWSCSVPPRQDCRSRLCFAALGPTMESSCQVLMESVSCARSLAAFCAAGSFQWYSWTRHSVVPFASREMELHSTTSDRRVRLLLHAPNATTQESAISFTRWDFMAPNIAKRALAEQQEHVVKCMGPSSYPKSPEQVQTTEKQSRDRAKDEGIDVQPIAEGADIVERGENEGAEHRRGDAGDEGAPAQQFGRAPGEQSHEYDAEEQLLVDAGAEGQHQHRPAAQPLLGESDSHRRRGTAQQRCGEATDDNAEHEGQADTLEQHAAQHGRRQTTAVRAYVPRDEPGAEGDQAQHEQARAPGAGEPNEHGLEYHIGAVADAQSAGSRRRERSKDLIEDQQG